MVWIKWCKSCKENHSASMFRLGANGPIGPCSAHLRRYYQAKRATRGDADRDHLRQYQREYMQQYRADGRSHVKPSPSTYVPKLRAPKNAEYRALKRKKFADIQALVRKAYPNDNNS